ncbi:MAG: polyphosphate kinase 1 [Zetaproteobacteria bacterium]|nr:MAG: polyphosphate kinase 1 [Zetaproteobacteria bacterium]
MLEFHRRVYELAADPSIPLLERLRFLCISSSNLDEFFEVRVAIIKHRLSIGSTRTGADGLRATELLAAIRDKVERLVADQYRLLNDTLLPALEAEGVRVIRRGEWSDAQRDWIRGFFRRELLPLLTPIGLDPAHPFPMLVNKVLSFIVELDGCDAFGRQTHFGVVQAPRVLPRLIRLPAELVECADGFVLLSSIIHAHVGELFPGLKVKSCHQFRVTRNAELLVDEDEVEDLKSALACELRDRRFSQAVRLEVSTKCKPELARFLLRQFELEEQDLYFVDGLVNLSRLETIYEEVDRPDLKYPRFEQGMPEAMHGGEVDMFALLRKGDQLLHHPFQSFRPVVDFLRQAATDPDVLAIKQTLYRVVPDSPIVEALVKAALSGKQVVAVIELRARFNEEDNIALANRLSKAGVQVVYGVVGYKTHGKMLLVVRREGRQIRRYVHLGTGNYHSITTRYYTDIGILSANPDLGEDVHHLFQQLTGMGKATRMKRLLQAPFTLHSGLIERINLEAANAQDGGKARIIAKMNGLEEPEIIRALYRASQAGVEIDLIVRGICCLRPGIKGVSENIRVRSVLGRFLEHTRIFYFYNGGRPELLCASADWMIRNLLRRVESCFPIYDRKMARQLIHDGLRLYLQDNCGSWRLREDGSYHRVQARKKRRSAQEILMRKFGRLG